MIRGGQGRSSRAVREDAVSWGMILIGVVLWVGMILAIGGIK